MAKFIDSDNVIDAVDVGMTALYANDCLVLVSILWHIPDLSFRYTTLCGRGCNRILAR